VKMSHNDKQAQKIQQYKLDHPDQFYQAPEGSKCMTKLAAVPKHFGYYFKRMNINYGWQFLATLTSTYFLVKGTMYTLTSTLRSIIFLRVMKLDGTSYQVMFNISQSPWSLKPLMGLLSDIFPINGYRKKWYCVMFALCGTMAFAILGTFELPAGAAIPAALLILLLMLQIAGSDLLVEGQYAELMVKQPEVGSDIVSWVWAAIFLGNLCVIELYGYMVNLYAETQDYNTVRIFSYVCMCVSLQNAIPFLLNWLGETRIKEGERGPQLNVWNEQRGLCYVGISMGCASILNIIVNIVSKELVPIIIGGENPDKHPLKYLPVFIYSILISAFLIFMGVKFMHPIAAKANAYMFVASAAFVSIGGIMEPWYLTTDEECLPGGPRFSARFYYTTTEYASVVVSLAGVFLFQGVMSKYKLRPCFWVTTLAKSIISIWEFAFVMRWTTSWISDEAAYLVGGKIVEGLMGQLDFMPGVVMTSKLCPKGSESIMYAILAGFQNFGSALSSNLGAFTAQALQIFTYLEQDVEAGSVCQNLDLIPWVILGGGIIFPLISIPFTWWLIPDAYVAGSIIDKDGNEWPPKDDEEDEESVSKEVEDSLAKDVPMPPMYPAGFAQPAPVAYDPAFAYGLQGAEAPATTPMPYYTPYAQ